MDNRETLKFWLAVGAIGLCIFGVIVFGTREITRVDANDGYSAEYRKTGYVLDVDFYGGYGYTPGTVVFFDDGSNLVLDGFVKTIPQNKNVTIYFNKGSWNRENRFVDVEVGDE